MSIYCQNSREESHAIADRKYPWWRARIIMSYPIPVGIDSGLPLCTSVLRQTRPEYQSTHPRQNFWEHVVPDTRSREASPDWSNTHTRGYWFYRYLPNTGREGTMTFCYHTFSSRAAVSLWHIGGSHYSELTRCTLVDILRNIFRLQALCILHYEGAYDIKEASPCGLERGPQAIRFFSSRKLEL